MIMDMLKPVLIVAVIIIILVLGEAIVEILFHKRMEKYEHDDLDDDDSEIYDLTTKEKE